MLVAAVRSRRGASFRLLESLGDPRWRPGPALFKPDGRALIARMVEVGVFVDIYFRWREFSRDPDDGFVLELGVNGRAQFLVTHNLRDFRSAQQFGIHVPTPAAF